MGWQAGASTGAAIPYTPAFCVMVAVLATTVMSHRPKIPAVSEQVTNGTEY